MAPTDLRGRRVLIAEDEYAIAQDLATELAARGAAVVGPVPSVEWAMALIRLRVALKAAVLDINLRGVEAYLVADALRHRGVPFLFVTGYDRGAIPPRFAGVPVCLKPTPGGDVAGAVARLLAV